MGSAHWKREMMNEYPEWEPVEGKQARFSPLKRFLWGCLVLGLIITFLATGISAVVWLWQRDRPDRVVSVPTETAVSPTTPAMVTAVSPTLTLTTTLASSALAVNRLVFINLQGQVETMAADGSQRHSLTANEQRFQFPTWSPDGQSIAVIGSDRRGGGIYLLRDTAEMKPPEERYFSREQSPFYLYWSPDSRQISFLAGGPDGDMALFVASALGDPENRQLTTGNPFYWYWLADSQQMLIHAGGSGDNARLALLDATTVTDAQPIAAPGLFQTPSVSADGRFWAYALTEMGGLSWLTVQDRVSKSDFRVRHAGQVALGWHPTQNWLAMISGEPESSNFYGPLRLVDAETGESRLLSREQVLAFFWSPDGRYLATIALPGENEDILAQGAGGRNGRVQAKPATWAQLTPHGFQLRLIDVQNGEDRLLTTFEPTLVFLSQFLPFFDQYAHSHRLWSPDSQTLVLPQRANRQNQVWLIPITGEPIRLTEGDMPFWSWQ